MIYANVPYHSEAFGGWRWFAEWDTGKEEETIQRYGTERTYAIAVKNSEAAQKEIEGIVNRRKYEYPRPILKTRDRVQKTR